MAKKGLIKKGNLKLIWINPKKQNKIQDFIKWLTKTRAIELKIPDCIRWWKTEEEKIEILKNVLEDAFGDYDYTTNAVNLYPMTRAQNEIDKMIKNGTLDYYFERYILSERYMKKLNKMQEKFERKQA